MKLNKKGFTLVELLGVLVIIGLVLMMAFPAVSRLINSNDDEVVDQYKKLIDEAAYAYAGTQKSELGTVNDEGCTRVTLDTLQNQEFLTFNDSKITCTIKSASDNSGGKITIRNNKGNLTLKYGLVCTKNGKIIYSSGSSDETTCTRYKIEEKINLFLTLSNSSSVTKVQEGNIVYITNGNNYIRYSGHIWRVVSYNNITEEVKAVTADQVVTLRYNSVSTNNSYTNSEIETWLNNDFSTSLKDSDKFVKSTRWKPADNVYRKSKVGLITEDEVNHIKNWFNLKTWLLDNGSSGKNSYYSGSAVDTIAPNTFMPVVPSVTFNSDLEVQKGNGSLSNPYVIDGTDNAVGKANELLNTRFSGEYVTFNGNTYRIISTSTNGTKLIGTTVHATDVNFSTDSGEGSLFYLYESANIGVKYNVNKEGLNAAAKDMLTTGDFCMDTITNTTAQNLSKRCLTPGLNKAFSVGLPKIGELFTVKSPSGSYWTLNPNTVDNTGGTYEYSTINTVNESGEVGTTPITGKNNVLLVVYINPAVKITGGSGTSSSPYTIAK